MKHSLGRSASCALFFCFVAIAVRFATAQSITESTHRQSLPSAPEPAQKLDSAVQSFVVPRTLVATLQ